MAPRAPIPELPTIEDLRAAHARVEALRERRDLLKRLPRWQTAIVRFWQIAARYHAQADALALLNDARFSVFRRDPVNPCDAPRLYTACRSGTRRSSLQFYPSLTRIARELLKLPGAAHRTKEIAASLGGDVRNVKVLLAKFSKETHRASA